ncbi:hypothetical protein [Maribacter luteus]|uniref:hypothetical protein n=1 Tax=Maribacter luteus TaxID=2594478 RepID=UPI002491799D|nr:hypothetical protein [Maribacter luteus]
MKNPLLFLIVLFGVITSSNSQNKYDFSQVKSEAALYELLDDMKKKNNASEIELPKNKYDNTTVRVKGMYYDNVPIISAVFSGNLVKIVADTIPNVAKKLLHIVEAKKGLTRPVFGNEDEIKFEWKSETEEISLTILLVDGENITALGDLDMAFMYLSFYTP